MGLVFYNGINDDRNYHLSHILLHVRVRVYAYVAGYSKGVYEQCATICQLGLRTPNNNVDSLKTVVLE